MNKQTQNFFLFVASSFIALLIVTCYSQLIFKRTARRPLVILKPVLKFDLNEKSKPKPCTKDLEIQSFFDGKTELCVDNYDRAHSIIFAGDVLLARSVNYEMNVRNNLQYPFEKVAHKLRAADLTFVNLENPLVEDCSLTNEGTVFCGSVENTAALSYAGIDLVGVSNNHAFDQGGEGLERTINSLESAGISPVGAGDVIYMNIRGNRFAFLGFDLVSKRTEKNSVEIAIRKADKKADTVVVYFHWGREYTSKPTARQRTYARLAVDAGAALVIGSHPHWLQGVEVYKNTPVLYSLGNFIFDQDWSERTRKGTAVKVYFYEGKVLGAEFLPTYMETWTQPHFLEGAQKEKAVQELFELSRELQ